MPRNVYKNRSGIRENCYLILVIKDLETAALIFLKDDSMLAISVTFISGVRKHGLI